MYFYICFLYMYFYICFYICIFIYVLLLYTFFSDSECPNRSQSDQSSLEQVQSPR